MAREDKNKDNVYKECRFVYADNTRTFECGECCKEHASCNFEMTGYAMNKMEVNAR